MTELSPDLTEAGPKAKASFEVISAGRRADLIIPGDLPPELIEHLNGLSLPVVETDGHLMHTRNVRVEGSLTEYQEKEFVAVRVIDIARAFKRLGMEMPVIYWRSRADALRWYDGSKSVEGQVFIAADTGRLVEEQAEMVKDSSSATAIE